MGEKSKKKNQKKNGNWTPQKGACNCHTNYLI